MAVERDISTLVLEQIKAEFLLGGGLKRKQPIKKVAKLLADVSGIGSGQTLLGDDAAVIDYGEEFLLLAADGINLNVFKDYYWAGYCSVLVNVNDIYAMGGEPIAMVNVIGGEPEKIDRILAGIRTGCKKFAVPMVGGHVHPEPDIREISVAILGRAKKILSSFNAHCGDDLILAIDLDGEQYNGYSHWDTTTKKSSQEVIRRLNVVKNIAEQGLAQAAKDISNPGILGTIGMLLETSGLGAEVDLSKIPVPCYMELRKWLAFYPGFAFIFSVDPKNSAAVCRLFSEVGVASEVVGRVQREPRLILQGKENSIELMDFRLNHITGIIA